MDGARSTASERRFGRFTLDPARCALRGPDDSEVVLRPKTFAVLHELLAHRGEVVTREALLTAVWPNVMVSDESLTQCIRELRVALGPGGSGMLRTLPRRGYMLDLQQAGSEAAADPAGTPPAAPLRRWILPGIAGAILLGVAAWHVMLPAPAGAPAIPSRSQAEQLTDRANHWYRNEAGPAAWRGQRELYQRAVAADPGHVPGWVGLALSNANLVHYRHSDDPGVDFQAAEAAASRAYALAPNSAEANAAVGAVDRLRPDRLEQSLAAYQRSLDLSPGDFSVRAQLGWMMAQLGRPEDGEVLLRAALVLAPPGHPFRPSWYYYLGMIDLLLGRDGHGLDWLREAQAAGGAAYLDADRFDLTMVAALAQAGRRDEAAAMLRDVLSRRPGLTLQGLRDRPPWGSLHPTFKAQLERVFDGLVLAGMQ